jgi:hypothetical protein
VYVIKPILQAAAINCHTGHCVFMGGVTQRMVISPDIYQVKSCIKLAILAEGVICYLRPKMGVFFACSWGAGPVNGTVQTQFRALQGVMYGPVPNQPRRVPHFLSSHMLY